MPRDFKTAITVDGVAVSLATHTHAGGAGGYAATIGDGSAQTFTLSHGLGTRDVIVRCYVVGGVYEDVQPVVTRPSTSEVRLYFLSAPAANGVRVLIQA